MKNEITKVESAVFLDRDGVLSRASVINGKSFAPRQLSNFKLLPGANQSILRLRKAGFKVIVVTNQPDIGNGLTDYKVVETMHEKLNKKLDLDAIYVCPHRQIDDCICRKPKPGMLLKAAIVHGIDLSKSFMVGDRASDIEAGNLAGCTTIFINRHYAEPSPDRQNCTVSSLSKAVDCVLSISSAL